MENLLGTGNSVLQFKPDTLYSHNPNLNSLQEPFTQFKIEAAVRQLQGKGIGSGWDT